MNSSNLIQRIQNNSNLGDFTGIFTDILQSNGVAMNDFISIPFDIIEEDNKIKIFGYIPGVNLSTLSVDFYNNVLEVKGERIKPYSRSSLKYREEIIYGPFNKNIELPICITSPSSVLVSKTENGVLEIVIDKRNEERNRFSVNVQNEEEEDDIEEDEDEVDSEKEV
jgi:HSP20 family molecular chaperone IbpA